MGNLAAPPAPSLPWRFSTRTPDVELASEQGAQTYYPLRMTVLGRPERFLMSIDALQLGPILVGDCRFNADIRMDFGELRDYYHLNVPLSGRLDSVNLRNEVTATPRRAVLYGPAGDIRLGRWSAGGRILCVKIRREALEDELSRLLQRPVGRIDLAPSMALDTGLGRHVRDIVRVMARQYSLPVPLVRQENIGLPLWHGLLAALLAAADHRYRDELLNPRPPYRTPQVKRVVDAVHAAPQTPFTAASLAGIAGVAVRTLQEAFRRHLGTTPMEYLRQVRLERVRADLLAADPARTTVSEVAHRWGFAHLGRFAAAYGRRYGEHPSRTLRAVR